MDFVIIFCIEMLDSPENENLCKKQFLIK